MRTPTAGGFNEPVMVQFPRNHYQVTYVAPNDSIGGVLCLCEYTYIPLYTCIYAIQACMQANTLQITKYAHS